MEGLYHWAEMLVKTVYFALCELWTVRGFSGSVQCVLCAVMALQLVYNKYLMCVQAGVLKESSLAGYGLRYG